jgi:hypothetical protein
VGFPVCHVDALNRLLGGIVDQVELLSSLLLMPGLELFRDKLV